MRRLLPVARWSLRYRIMISVWILVLVIVLGWSTMFIVHYKRSALAQSYAMAYQLCAALAVPCEYILLYGRLDYLNSMEVLNVLAHSLLERQRQTRLSEQQPPFTVVLTNERGRILAADDPHRLGEAVQPSILTDALQRRTPVVELRTLADGEHIVAASALSLGTQVVGFLVLTMSLEEVDARIHHMWFNVAFLALSLSVLSGIVAAWLSRRITTPLSTLIQRVRRFTLRGMPADGPASTNPTTGDEVTVLMEQFELMEERLHRAVDRLHLARQRAVSSERLAAMGRVAVGVAHEINNPLDGIQNCVRRIREGRLSEQRREEYFDLVEEGLSRIGRITRQLLALGRSRPATRELEDLGDLVRKTLVLLEPRLGDQVQLETRLPDAPVLTRTDAQKFQQVLLNLLLNALDAVEPDGRIEISCRIETDVDGAREAVLTISDNGPGMPPDVAARAFDPFFSTKEDGNHSGLGLAIAQSMIEELGGAIELHSEPGKGTRVTVRHPLNQGA
jgi:signal transduction histidine kinase